MLFQRKNHLEAIYSNYKDYMEKQIVISLPIYNAEITKLRIT